MRRGLRAVSRSGRRIAGLSLLLAAAGLFALLSFTVRRRSREIGVRVAVGASRRDVVSMVLRQALLLAAGGCACGWWWPWVCATWCARRCSASRPWRRRPWCRRGPLLMLAVLASVSPAWRALRVEPAHHPARRVTAVVVSSAAPADPRAAAPPASRGPGDTRAVALGLDRSGSNTAWRRATTPPGPSPRAPGGDGWRNRPCGGAGDAAAPVPCHRDRRHGGGAERLGPKRRAPGPDRRRRADSNSGRAASRAGGVASTRPASTLVIGTEARGLVGRVRARLRIVDAADDCGVVSARDAIRRDHADARAAGASDHAAAARRLAATALRPANHRRRARSASARRFSPGRPARRAARALRATAAPRPRRRRPRTPPTPARCARRRAKRCHAGHRTCLNSPDSWCASRTRASRSRSSCRPLCSRDRTAPTEAPTTAAASSYDSRAGRTARSAPDSVTAA